MTCQEGGIPLPGDPGTWSAAGQEPTGLWFCCPHTGFCRGQRRCTELRLLQRCARGWPRCVTKWRLIPGRGLPSLAGPPSGTEAGGVPCSAMSSPVLPGKFRGGGWQAGPCLCPLPTALCPPHAATRRWWPGVIRTTLGPRQTAAQARVGGLPRGAVAAAGAL